MLRDWVKLLRLPNALVAGLGTWLGHACLPAPLDLRAAWLGSAAMALLAAAGNVQNDILDLAADRINRPGRALPSGRVRRGSAALAAWVLYLGALAAAWTAGPRTGMLAAGMAVLLCLYNLRLKSLPLWGNLAVALLCALAVYLPEFPAPPRYTGMAALFAFLATWAREMAKDAEDMEGDRAAGWSTLPLRFGTRATRAAVAAVALLTLLLLPAPAWLGYQPGYFLAAAAGPAPLLLLTVRDSARTFPRWGAMQRRLKWTMLAGMVAILAGVYR